MGHGASKNNLRYRLHARHEAWEKASPGSKVLSCSFERWVNSSLAEECGYRDNADYDTPRDDFRGKGFLLRPDVTDGRFIRSQRISSCRINLEERRAGTKISVEIEPCCTSGKIPQKLRVDHRTLVLNYVQQQTNKDGVGVVGCHGSLAVVQVLDRKECYVPEFYFIDLQRGISLGKFATKDSELLWYECYISPDKSCVLLRPDMNTQTWTTLDTIKTHTVNKIQVITMRKFADSGGHVLTFDNRHGHRYLFRAKDKDVQLFDFAKMEVVQSAKCLALPAGIRQIKSCPSGEFLAVRCAYPSYSMEFQTNTVAILQAETINILFTVDVKGPYWPISEVVNQQVFPRFSACESTVAVMRHKASKRKIAVYKLPVLCSSLQHFCRRVIRRYVYVDDLAALPLPNKIIRYLKYDLWGWEIWPYYILSTCDVQCKPYHIATFTLLLTVMAYIVASNDGPYHYSQWRPTYRDSKVFTYTNMSTWPVFEKKPDIFYGLFLWNCALCSDIY